VAVEVKISVVSVRVAPEMNEQKFDRRVREMCLGMLISGSTTMRVIQR